MQRNSLTLPLLLIVSLAAGCVTPAPSSSSQAAPIVAGQGEPSPPLRNVTLDFSIYQTISPSTPICDPTNPDECSRIHAVGTFYITGSWNGTAPYSAYCHYNETAQTGSCVYDSILFSGSMGACGTGSVTMHAIDWVDRTPNPQGIHFTGVMTLTPGTGTGDLARVASIDARWDTVMGAAGSNFPTGGTMTCA
jgi:hypothetical protein